MNKRTAALIEESVSSVWNEGLGNIRHRLHKQSIDTFQQC